MHEHADEHCRAGRSQQQHDAYAAHGSSSQIVVASDAGDVPGSSRGLRSRRRRFWLAGVTVVARKCSSAALATVATLSLPSCRRSSGCSITVSFTPYTMSGGEDSGWHVQEACTRHAEG